jgi:4-hydroxybenzoate polyprenyltransferase
MLSVVIIFAFLVLMLKTIFILLRVPHYIKNFFVFAPLLFSFQYSVVGFFRTSLAFFLFSLIASSIYIINDLVDIEEDRQHPVKQYRPLASGRISRTVAFLISIGLVLTALIVAFFLNVQLAAILLAYYILNIFYSFKLKHIVIIDICTIAVGFILRIFAGAVAADVSISMWLILMTFLLALFLGLAKRRDDVLLAEQGRGTRKNIDGYTIQFVDSTMTLMAGVIIVSYIQYTISKDVMARLQTENLYLTSFFVILGIMRYMQVTIVELASGSPTKIVLTDTFLQITIFLWLASFFIISWL